MFFWHLYNVASPTQHALFIYNRQWRSKKEPMIVQHSQNLSTSHENEPPCRSWFINKWLIISLVISFWTEKLNHHQPSPPPARIGVRVVSFKNFISPANQHHCSSSHWRVDQHGQNFFSGQSCPRHRPASSPRIRFGVISKSHMNINYVFYSTEMGRRWKPVPGTSNGTHPGRQQQQQHQRMVAINKLLK